MKGEDDEILVFTIEPNYESIIALKDETVFLPKERRKAPCFSYGDIRRTLSCVMWESAV